MNDFDFLTGTWDVTNRRRSDLLDETSPWEEFPGVSQASQHFGGRANFDEIDFPTKGFTGLTLRLYDADHDQWSLYWASTRSGTILPPVVGRFADGKGEFYGDDTHAGKAIRTVPALVDTRLAAGPTKTRRQQVWVRRVVASPRSTNSKR